MSIEASMWARHQTTGSANRKQVLTTLADYADEEWSCFPGQERIASETELSVRTVRRMLAELEIAGFIERVPRFRADGTRTSDRIYLRPRPKDSVTGGPETTGQPDHDHRPNASRPPATVTGHEPSEEPEGEPSALETSSTDVDDRPEVDDLCVELADAIGSFRGGTRGGRPAITARWHRDMRLLLDRGPLGGDQPAKVTRDNVHGFIQVVFTELADPDGGGFCWAAQVQSPQAIRRHWWKVRQAAIALHQRSRHGKLAAVSRAVTGEEPEDLAEVLARHQRWNDDRHAALAGGTAGQLALGVGG